jgi:hypothetical protein
MKQTQPAIRLLFEVLVFRAARRPVDVTTTRTTPADILIAAPSPTIERMHGGVPWIQA